MDARGDDTIKDKKTGPSLSFSPQNDFQCEQWLAFAVFVLQWQQQWGKLFQVLNCLCWVLQGSTLAPVAKLLQSFTDIRVLTLAWVSHAEFTQVHVQKRAAEEIMFLWLCLWVPALNSMLVSTPAGRSLWMSHLGVWSEFWRAEE